MTLLFIAGNLLVLIFADNPFFRGLALGLIAGFVDDLLRSK